MYKIDHPYTRNFVHVHTDDAPPVMHTNNAPPVQTLPLQSNIRCVTLMTPQPISGGEIQQQLNTTVKRYVHNPLTFKFQHPSISCGHKRTKTTEWLSDVTTNRTQTPRTTNMDDTTTNQTQ